MTIGSYKKDSLMTYRLCAINARYIFACQNLVIFLCQEQSRSGVIDEGHRVFTILIWIHRIWQPHVCWKLSSRTGEVGKVVIHISIFLHIEIPYPHLHAARSGKGMFKMKLSPCQLRRHSAFSISITAPLAYALTVVSILIADAGNCIKTRSLVYGFQVAL